MEKTSILAFKLLIPFLASLPDQFFSDFSNMLCLSNYTVVFSSVDGSLRRALLSILSLTSPPASIII